MAAVVDYIGETKGNIRLPGVMMLGYVAAHSEVLAMSVIVSKVCLELEVTRDERAFEPTTPSSQG